MQCGAQPDEASKTLTRRPATYNHASDFAHRLQHGCGLDTDADWLRTLPGHGHGLDTDLNLDVLGGHGAAIARPFCGHFAATETFAG